MFQVAVRRRIRVVTQRNSVSNNNSSNNRFRSFSAAAFTLKSLCCLAEMGQESVDPSDVYSESTVAPYRHIMHTVISGT